MAADSPASDEVTTADSPAVDEIIVTATKMGETNLQETPIAITSFSSDQINRTGVKDVRDLVAMTPNLNISQNSAFAQIYIRGIGSNNVFSGADPSSTIHVDGVYISRPTSYFTSFLDVERIEVLRGPQGTIYGRNSVGGTINVISRKPNNDLQAKLQGAFGSHDLFRVEGYVSGPLVKDKLAASVALMRSKHDGYLKNIVPGARDLDSEDLWSGRVQLRATPNDRLEILIRGDYSKDEGVVSGNVKLLLPYANFEDSILGDLHRVAIDSVGYMERKDRGISGEVKFDLSDAAKLTSVTAFRKSDLHSLADSDATSLFLQTTEFNDHQKQFSEELNLSGRLNNLKYVFGVYYIDEDMASDSYVRIQAAGLAVHPHPSVHTNAWALFGQATYDITDQFSVTAGLRYTEEKKTFEQNYDRFLFPSGTIVYGPIEYVGSNTYKAWTPKFGVEYRPVDDLMIYASATRGFKSGGFNFTSTNPAQGYEPEFLWSYEAGFKSELFDRRLRLNATGFFYDYTDLQVQSFLTPGVIDITNAADATVKGVEVEAIARPVRGLDLGATLAFLDAKYKTYNPAFAPGNIPFDASGNRLNSAPKWNYSLFGQYTAELNGIGTLFMRGEYSWRSLQYFTAVNAFPEAQKSYGLVNASLGFTSPDGRWQATVFGRNLANTQYITSSASFTARPAGHVGEPRTWGVKLSFTY